MRILFCYAFNKYFYYRHVFCVFQGEIIEPLEHIAQEIDIHRIITIKELSADEYYALIAADERYDLFPSLYNDEVQIFNDNKALMHELNPVDMNALVFPQAKTQENYLQLLADVQAGKGIPFESSPI